MGCHVGPNHSGKSLKEVGTYPRAVAGIIVADKAVSSGVNGVYSTATL